MKPESARRAARVVEIKAEIAYMAPHETKICAHCLHITTRGPRGVQARCTRYHIDIAAKGSCEHGFIKRKAVRGSRGSLNPSAKLTEADIPAIWLRLYAGGRLIDIAREFNVTKHAIWAIHVGKAWRHVPRPPLAGAGVGEIAAS